MSRNTGGWHSAVKHPTQQKLVYDGGDVRCTYRRKFREIATRDWNSPPEFRWTSFLTVRATDATFIGKGPTSESAWYAALAQADAAAAEAEARANLAAVVA